MNVYVVAYVDYGHHWIHSIWTEQERAEMAARDKNVLERTVTKNSYRVETWACNSNEQSR